MKVYVLTSEVDEYSDYSMGVHGVFSSWTEAMVAATAVEDQDWSAAARNHQQNVEQYPEMYRNDRWGPPARLHLEWTCGLYEGQWVVTGQALPLTGPEMWKDYEQYAVTEYEPGELPPLVS